MWKGKEREGKRLQSEVKTDCGRLPIWPRQGTENGCTHCVRDLNLSRNLWALKRVTTVTPVTTSTTTWGTEQLSNWGNCCWSRCPSSSRGQWGQARSVCGLCACTHIGVVRVLQTYLLAAACIALLLPSIVATGKKGVRKLFPLVPLFKQLSTN